MSSSTNQKRPWFARKIALVAITCLSLYLPCLVSSWSVKGAFANLQSGSSLTEQKIFGRNCIRDQQAWFISSQRKKNAASFEYSIKRLDLKTGIIHETKIPKTVQSRNVIVIGNEVYVVSDRAIYQVVDDQFVEPPIGASPLPPLKQTSGLFQFQGKLTFASQQQDGQLRLLQLVNGEWVEGPEIRIPTFREIWGEEPEFDQELLAADPHARYEPSIALSVLQDRQGDILFLTSTWRPYTAFGGAKARHLFRRGFQFIEKQEDAASALHADNATEDATGWEPTTTIMPNGKSTRLDISIQSIACDTEGPILSFWTPNNDGIFETTRICRRGADGQLRDLSGLSPGTRCQTVVDPSDGTAYLIEESADNWNSVAIRRIGEQSIQPTQVSLEGGAVAYTTRWRYLLAGLLAAWMIHYLFMVAAAACLAVDVPTPRYECDMHTAEIAPIWKRIGAATIDLFSNIVILFAVWYGLIAISGPPWTESDTVRVADLLREIHRYAEECLNAVERMELAPRYQFERMMAAMTESLSLKASFYAGWVGLAFVIGAINQIVEGYRGITLGKWLFGTRTVSSGLTHPGLFSAFTRAALCPIDFFFLLTPIPAIGFMWLSSTHRRLGDHCADTVVINFGSVRTEDWYHESTESQ